MARVETRTRKQPARASRARVSLRASPASDSTTVSVASESDAESEVVQPSAKRRRVTTRKNNGTTTKPKPWDAILSVESRAPSPPAIPPIRSHGIPYHRPLLLDSSAGQSALLDWFDGVSSSRLMPWRKAWIDPRVWTDDAEGLRAALERRAYEVWISEIMLQQTRVAVVIDYWKRWMDKWPTIQDLARADAEHVLTAWKGLGYYSRATRIHQAAKLVVDDPSMQGLLPAEANELKAKVPGVGPYTAGAISAIVFGHPEAMVDGNVIRVLSRQMGVLADFKSSKLATDLIWQAADALVKVVSSAHPSERPGTTTIDPVTSDRPGRWGQALMELGSTICTPKPDCSQCPITATCRAFAEGMVTVSVSKQQHNPSPPIRGVGTMDIEDVCTLCQPIEDLPVEGVTADQASKTTSARARKAASAVSSSSRGQAASADLEKTDRQILDAVVEYARRFPAKGVKKAVRVQESVVCAIRCGGSYLVQKRPSKGLLAGLWELPSYDIAEGNKSTATSRKRMAQSFVSALLKHSPDTSAARDLQLRHVGELGSVPWLFSHIHLTMHVHVFELAEHAESMALPELKRRWVSSKAIDRDLTMGTGMCKCWAMVVLSS